MPASAPDVHELECYFYKRCSTSKHRWQRRLFRLDGRALFYFDDPSSSENKAAKKRALWLHKVQFVRERTPKSASVGGGSAIPTAYFLDIGYGDRLFTLRDQTDEHLLVWAQELRSRREAVLTELRKNDANASRPEAGEIEEDVRSERSALTVSSWLDSESAAASAAGKSSADDVGTATTEDDRVSVVSTPMWAGAAESCAGGRAGFLGDRLVGRMETWIEAEFSRQAQTRS
eukprot:g8257.t1